MHALRRALSGVPLPRHDRIAPGRPRRLRGVVFVQHGFRGREERGNGPMTLGHEYPRGRGARRCLWGVFGAVALIGATAIAPLLGVASSASTVTTPGSRASGVTATATCTTKELVIWIDTQSGGETAGSAYYNLEFTNLSTKTCFLQGYSGVSGVSLAGHQIGNAAARNATAVPTSISILPGDTAMAIVQLTDTGNFPPASCRSVTAAGMRVFPPGQRSSKVVPYPFPACSRSGESYLHVEAVERRP
jgi:hypothetical protein